MSAPESSGVSTLTRLLPLACLASALCLFASETMTMFEFTPPGAEALSDQGAGERHGNAMYVIAAFAIGALALAVFTASKPAAIAVAAMGIVALLFFLLGDLPDAGQVGTLDDARGSFFDAETVPQEGFWLLMVSSVGLTVTGIALATLTAEQLAALGPARLRANSAAALEEQQPEEDAGPREPAAEDERAARRLDRRRRPRQRR